jgi:hypothetical protein
MNAKTVLLNRVIEEESRKRPLKERMQSNLKVLRYTRKRPLYADGRTPCIDSSKLGTEPLMYSRSVVKTSYDRGSILKWFFRSPG